MFIQRLQILSLSSLVWGLGSAIAPTALRAEVPLTRADVESVHSTVEYIPDGRLARPATVNDWLALGDALRTAAGARAELRFNDGSLARIGERATFWFVPNTRNFRLSNGTALFLIPPNRGPSNIETPSAVTGIQGTALVVRHIPYACAEAECPGRTIVMVLTDSPKGPVEVTTENGSRAALSAGNLAIIENNSIQVLEFNLDLFYQTSPLVDGLNLDNPDFEGSGLPTDPVQQETLDGLAAQAGFTGTYVLNPDVVSLDAAAPVVTSWLLPPEGAIAAATATAPINGNQGMGNAGGNGTVPTMANLLPTRASIPAGIIDLPAGRPVGRVTNTAFPSGPMGVVVSTPGQRPAVTVVNTPVSNGNQPPATAPATRPAVPTASDGGQAPTVNRPAESPSPTGGGTPAGGGTGSQGTPPPVVDRPNQPAAPTSPPISNPAPPTVPETPIAPGGGGTPPITPTPGDPGGAPQEPFTPPGNVDTTPPDTFNPPGNPNPTPSPEPFTPPGNPNPSPVAPPFSPPGGNVVTPIPDVGAEVPILVDPIPNNIPGDPATTVPGSSVPAGVITGGGNNPAPTPEVPITPEGPTGG